MRAVLPRAIPAALLALLLAAAVSPASAQWAWKDENGRVVYSDRPPPASVKPDQIVRQGSLGGGSSASGGAAAEGKDSKSGPKTYAEREMDYRKRQQAQAEADKKAGEESAQNTRKAAECERARGYLKALEEGQRIQRTDAQGNREILDDSQRAAEITRIRDSMARACG
jgi:Domain of unknown function (DUF4124)